MAGCCFLKNLYLLANQKIKIKLRRSNGFTLIESLIAIGILGYVLGGILLLFVKCHILNRNNRDLTIATSHAQFVMEDIVSRDFHQLKNEIDENLWNWSVQNINDQGLNALKNEEISATYSLLGSDLLQINVEVLWQNADGRPDSFLIETFLEE